MTRCARPHCGGSLVASAEFDALGNVVTVERCASCSRTPEQALAPIPEVLKLFCPYAECFAGPFTALVEQRRHVVHGHEAQKSHQKPNMYQRRTVHIRRGRIV